jgi:urease beta subunit
MVLSRSKTTGYRAEVPKGGEMRELNGSQRKVNYGQFIESNGDRGEFGVGQIVH